MVPILELIHKFLILAGIVALIIILWPALASLIHALNAIAHFFGS